jgi:hypothetical protein
MGYIEYRCPLHGVVSSRTREEHTRAADLQTCPFKHHPFDDECGRRLSFEFAQSSKSSIPR